MNGSRLVAFCLLTSVLSACATQVGVWPQAANVYALEKDDLEHQVRWSLANEGWHPVGATPGSTFIRPGRGGQQTVATFAFYGKGEESAFEIVGASSHAVNWLTFGIAGLSTQGAARRNINVWLQDWQEVNPPARGPVAILNEWSPSAPPPEGR
jgi:hypothetical protein